MGCGLNRPEFSTTTWIEILEFLEPEDILRLPLCGRRYYADHDFVELLIKVEGFDLNLVSPTLRTPDFCVSAIRRCNGDMGDMHRLLLSVPRRVWNPEIAVEAVLCWPELIPEFLPETLKTRDVALRVLTSENRRCAGDDALFQFPNFQSDREVVLKAVEFSGECLESASQILRADREVVLKALASSCSAVHYVDPSLFLDHAFLQEALQVLGNGAWVLIDFMTTRKLVLDREHALQAVKLSPVLVMRSLPESLRRCPSVWKTAVAIDVMALEHVPDEQCTREVMKLAVTRRPEVFAKVKRWMRDREIALLAFSLKGALLGHKSLKHLWSDDEGVVVAAVRENGLGLEFASPRLRSSDRVLRAALQQNGLALAYADANKRHWDIYVDVAVRQNYYAIFFSNRCYEVEKTARANGVKLPALPRAPGAPWLV